MQPTARPFKNSCRTVSRRGLLACADAARCRGAGARRHPGTALYIPAQRPRVNPGGGLVSPSLLLHVELGRIGRGWNERERKGALSAGADQLVGAVEDRTRALGVAGRGPPAGRGHAAGVGGFWTHGYFRTGAFQERLEVCPDISAEGRNELRP